LDANEQDDAVITTHAPQPAVAWHARRPLLQFVASGLIVMVLVGAISVLVSHNAGEREAVRDARTATSVLADALIAPAITPELAAGERSALAAFDAVIRQQVFGRGIIHVRVWDETGTIVYSDEPTLIGSTFTLSDDAREALDGQRVIAEVSDLTAEENALERHEGALLEVYAPVVDGGGRRWLFEAYFPYDQVGANAATIGRTFVPITLAALLALQLVQFPLAFRLTSTVKRARSDREQLLLRAVEASNAERRRIARDLHDGAVQDLVGVSYQLAALSERSTRWNDPAATERLRSADADTRGAIQTLRSLFVEIYPPNLAASGLENALNDLVASLRTRGVDVSVEVEPSDADRMLGERGTALAYRAAHEAIRNVERHAMANNVSIGVTCQPGLGAVVTVADDGIGFDGSRRSADQHDHFGLRMLTDLLADTGGRLQVDSQPGMGTTVRASILLGSARPATAAGA
jgi:signal transduction histidine kinase